MEEKEPVERKIIVRMGETNVAIDRSKFERVIALAEEVAREGRKSDFHKEVARRADVTKGVVPTILRLHEQMQEAKRRIEEQGLKNEH